jgi:hypothetical protein
VWPGSVETTLVVAVAERAVRIRDSTRLIEVE